MVLLATYTYENVRDAAAVEIEGVSNGLANNRGQVGRHYMTHATGAAAGAVRREPQ